MPRPDSRSVLSAHVTEEGSVVFEEKEGNDGCKVAGVVISSNNHQQEKEICSIPCSSKQQKAMNAKEPEQCVTPKRKGIGVLDTEKIIAQFSKEMTAIIQESIERKERKGKGGGTEGSVSAQARVKDVSEGSEKGERGLKNTMEWVKVVEELMKKDKGFDQKVKEALKEVNTYLWTVYDKKKEEYVEEGRNRAMRAATIFLVKVKLCPSWNRENGMLGKYLKANIDAVGARICHWAVTLNFAHVTEEGSVVFEEKEGNDGCKVAGVVISSNNHQQEKEICSIPCSSKQQKAMNAKEPEQCVTPKRKGIGVLDTEKIIAQFSKEMTAIIQESIERKERKGKGGGTEGSVSAQARVKDVSEGSEKGERG
nr:hypothetical protein Iba_chr04bCG11890 [Ipomoea batatas]